MPLMLLGLVIHIIFGTMTLFSNGQSTKYHDY